MDPAKISQIVNDALAISKLDRGRELSEIKETFPYLYNMICDETVNDDDIRVFMSMMLNKLKRLSSNQSTIEDETKEVSKALVERFHPQHGSSGSS